MEFIMAPGFLEKIKSFSITQELKRLKYGTIFQQRVGKI